MFPHSGEALAKLSQAQQLIEEAKALFTPSITITSFTPNPINISPGDSVSLTGTVTGNIVRVKIYDKNAQVLHDSLVPNNDGTWSADLDTTHVVVDDHMWFTAEGYDDAEQNTGRVAFSVDVVCKARETDNTPTPTENPEPTTDNPTTENPTPSEGENSTTNPAPVDPYAGTPAEGMTLVFSDDFSGDKLDKTKWFCGGKPRGGGPQWGGAHFVTGDEADFDKVYVINNGKLEIRAFHDDNYNDPEGWGRKWKSGQLSTAFPDHDVAAIDTGYVEVVMQLPASTGAWPGACLYSMYKNDSADAGGIEIDQEFFGDAKKLISYAIHDWPGTTGRTNLMNAGADFYTDNMPDTTTELVKYGMRVTEKDVIFYVNDKETRRYLKPQEPSSPLWLTLDLAIQENHVVDLPGEIGYICVVVDSVKIFRD